MTVAGDTLLAVRDLIVEFPGEEENVLAVRGASLDIEKGTTLGLVGESGCGKTVTAYSLLGLVPFPGRVTAGEIRYGGRDILSMDPEELRRLRGGTMGMVFQEPMTSLNPVFSIGYQLREAIELHTDLGGKAARRQAVLLLDRVGIADASRRIDDYPHEFSGGQRQRIMIAMALAPGPELLIADEPTTALDVTIQAQILDLLLKLQEEEGMTLLIITHDLGIVARMADRVAIMYAGEIVEEGSTEEVFNRPLHPYTLGLFRSLPRPGLGRVDLETIPGTVPNLGRAHVGCSFAPRCSYTVDACREGVIPLEEKQTAHSARCIRTREIQTST
jgi:oligopeptide/dipeptide ABC transporter ATP-binding protein